MPPLYLSNRPELAIMALAIKKAQEVFEGQPKGGYLGRTALQKILYFLVRRGVPLPYRFEIYNYGPFCSDVYHDVECLEADQVIEDKAKGSGKYWNYASGPNIDQLLEDFRDEVSPHEEVIDEVVEIFANFSPETLELIATLDFLFQDERARQAKAPTKKGVVDRFMTVKKNRFSRELVESTYDTLLAAQIFS